MATALETKVAEGYKTTAFEDVQKEHPKYFEALQQHPRLLIGQTVPAIGREGTEVLQTAEDAKDWQDAVKHVLVQEVQSRASKMMDDNAGSLEMLHSSISLFQDNPDLIPGTKTFDADLANRFAGLAEPYEVRVEGKLQGYSIPVQPFIAQLRAQLVAERSKAATAPPQAAAAQAGTPAAAGAASTPAPAAQPPVAADPPQAGITSKAGAGDPGEDFSTLFGTIGLPGLRI